MKSKQKSNLMDYLEKKKRSLRANLKNQGQRANTKEKERKKKNKWSLAPNQSSSQYTRHIFIEETMR
jgi:hypothetical protein